MLRIPNVIGGEIDTSDLKFLDVGEADRSRYLLSDGDILFVRTNGNPNYVGRCAVFYSPDPSRSWLYASYLIRARTEVRHADSAYLQTYLSFGVGRAALRERARTAAGQYNINTDGLRSVPVLLPPIERQRKFAEKHKGVARLESQLRTATKLAETSFQSLLAGMFGE